MRAELIPASGGPPIAITRDITLIGRREYCDIRLDDPSLSKRHCVLVKTDGLLMVRDLATTNGTRVKGQRIRWAALLPNDKLTIGKLNFRVHLGPDGSAGAVAARPARSQGAPPGRSDDAGGGARPVERPAPRPLALAPVDGPAAPADDRPGVDLADPNWFDRIGSGRAEIGTGSGEIIIDLD